MRRGTIAHSRPHSGYPYRYLYTLLFERCHSERGLGQTQNCPAKPRTLQLSELVAKNKTPQDTLTDDECIAVIRRLAKQRKDSIEQFEKGGRPELAETEKKELAVIETLLPQMMSLDDIKKVAEAKKVEMNVTDKAKAGILMGAVMKELKGKADGGDVKSVVESLFE